MILLIAEEENVKGTPRSDAMVVKLFDRGDGIYVIKKAIENKIGIKWRFLVNRYRVRLLCHPFHE